MSRTVSSVAKRQSPRNGQWTVSSRKRVTRRVPRQCVVRPVTAPLTRLTVTSVENRASAVAENIEENFRTGRTGRRPYLRPDGGGERRRNQNEGRPKMNVIGEITEVAGRRRLNTENVFAEYARLRSRIECEKVWDPLETSSSVLLRTLGGNISSISVMPLKLSQTLVLFTGRITITYD